MSWGTTTWVTRAGAACQAGDVAGSWSDDEDKVQGSVDRMRRLGPRLVGEAELLESLPGTIRSLLDLGCGDGRLARLALDARPQLRRVVAVDTSPPMLELARANLGVDERVTIEVHDLNDPISALATFDAVVSGFAIHHLADERKRTLFAEIAGVLNPGGVFVNLEVIRCATPELHAEFYRRIGRDADDPEDVLAPIEPQLAWMRDAGLDQVDCQWRWRGFALLAGVRA